MIFNFFKKGQTDFADNGMGISKDVLGGKGFGLAEMAKAGFPVPPGFTIPTEFCHLYMKDTNTIMTSIMNVVPDYLERLKKEFGYMPLVSVRSGAPMSMPGMMETILNVGLTHKNMEEWVDRIGLRPTLDSRRRLLQMMGETAFGIPKERFDTVFEKMKHESGAKTDADVPEETLALICDLFEATYVEAGVKLPKTFEEQLAACIGAVFRSWWGAKAVHYRKMNGMDDSMGTAVTVQSMVFGNMNEQSGSGVLFSRNASTGTDVILGEFLTNAQGEDVVAGIRTPLNLNEMQKSWPVLYTQLTDMAKKLEFYFRDMQDIEFTVQNGELFLLQTRNGKRTAEAAFRMAYDMYNHAMITRAEALSRITPEQYFVMMRPKIDPDYKVDPLFKGMPACNGLATGKLVFNSADAVSAKEPVILVRKETNPDDIEGMDAAAGILTSTGGVTSHAAVVARAMDKPCIVGASAMDVLESGGIITFTQNGQGYNMKAGDVVTIDGSTGNVYAGAVPVVDGSGNIYVQRLMNMLKDEHCIVFRDHEIGADRCVVAAEHFPISAVALTSEALAEAAQTFVTSLLTIPKQDISTLIIDVSPPAVFVNPDDLKLWDMYEPKYIEKSSAVFVASLVNALWEARATLKGCTLYSIESIPSKLTTTWFKRLAAPKTLAEALDFKQVVLTPAFIEKIVGSQEAWDLLAEKFNLKKASTPINKAEAVVAFFKAA